MTKIQILGTGCAKCNKLTELTEEAAEKSGIEYEMEKVSDIREIMKFGVMTTPALVVNGEVKVAGRVPALDELQKLIS